MEMYLAGVSVRRFEDIAQALWGMRVSAGTVSDLNQKMYEWIETWRNRPTEGVCPYVDLDGDQPQTHLGRRRPGCHDSRPCLTGPIRP